MGTEIADIFRSLDRVLGDPAPAPHGAEAAAEQAEAQRRAEEQRLLELLCVAYLGCDAGARAAIRSAFAERAACDLWLMNRCAHRLAGRVSGPGALTALRLALAAVSIENCALDYRDTLQVLLDLRARAQRAGLDPRPPFDDAAAMSADSRSPGGCESVAKLFLDVGSGAVR
jgi:hypothetical protein